MNVDGSRGGLKRASRRDWAAGEGALVLWSGCFEVAGRVEAIGLIVLRERGTKGTFFIWQAGAWCLSVLVLSQSIYSSQFNFQFISQFFISKFLHD